MRDDNDYFTCSRPELREHLTRVAKDLAVWSEALGTARRDCNLYWVDGYVNSQARSATERKMEADIAAAEFQREIYELEGRIAGLTVTRDLIVQLLMDVS